MNNSTWQVVLITGASSGIGRECAEYLARRGHRVYGTSRWPEIRTSGVPLLTMDVRDDGSVHRVVAELVAREGRLDVLVNNAGIGIAGAVEETSIDEARAQFETNFFGVLRVCKAVLPTMRRQAAGLIVNVSSLAGLIAIPFQGLYSASKYAIEAMTEALRMEVAAFGVRVALLEPGDFRTEFTANRVKTRESLESGIYRQSFDKALAVVEKEELNGQRPVRVAKAVERIMRRRSPALRYSVGPIFERLVPTLKKILPPRSYQLLMMKHFGL